MTWEGLLRGSCFPERCIPRGACFIFLCCAVLSSSAPGQTASGGDLPAPVPIAQDAVPVPPTASDVAPVSAEPIGGANTKTPTDTALGTPSKEAPVEREAVVFNPGFSGILFQLWNLIPLNFVVVPLVLASVIGFVLYRRARVVRVKDQSVRAVVPLPARPAVTDRNRDTASEPSVSAPKVRPTIVGPSLGRGASQPEAPQQKLREVTEPDTDLQLLPPSLDLDAQRQRIRDRYIAASFPGMVKNSSDLTNIGEVIKSARLCYGAGHAEQACELLHLAIEQQPHEPALWLAWLEVLFLTRQEERFVKVAHTFHHMHPYDRQWHEVAKLGLLLAPAHSLFQFAKTVRASAEGEGDAQLSWRNWLQADNDLVAEAAAADFHQRMHIRLSQR